MPLAFPFLAPINACPRTSLPVGARGLVECRYLHPISWTVALQESYEGSSRVFPYYYLGICLLAGARCECTRVKIVVSENVARTFLRSLLHRT